MIFVILLITKLDCARVFLQVSKEANYIAYKIDIYFFFFLSKQLKRANDTDLSSTPQFDPNNNITSTEFYEYKLQKILFIFICINNTRKRDMFIFFSNDNFLENMTYKIFYKYMHTHKIRNNF